MSPVQIAWKAFPIPVKTFSLTPSRFDAKINQAPIPSGSDLSSINNKASAINC